MAVGKCNKCKQDVILLSETRKEDFKIFHQLEVGKKAEKIGNLLLRQINYTYGDSKREKQVPSGWKYGKATRCIKNKAWKILRCDWYGNSEIIGYLPFNETKIINKEEYERIKK